MQGVCQMARFGNSWGVTIIDLRGSWSVANLATDYTIKDTSNDTLQVFFLLSDGDFNINY